jgi:hypothetical protein
MNHENELEQMANEAMFTTISPFLVIYDKNKQRKHKFARNDKIRTTYTCLDAYHHPNSP